MNIVCLQDIWTECELAWLFPIFVLNGHLIDSLSLFSYLFRCNWISLRKDQTGYVTNRILSLDEYLFVCHWFWHVARLRRAEGIWDYSQLPGAFLRSWYWLVGRIRCSQWYDVLTPLWPSMNGVIVVISIKFYLIRFFSFFFHGTLWFNSLHQSMIEPLDHRRYPSYNALVLAKISRYCFRSSNVTWITVWSPFLVQFLNETTIKATQDQWIINYKSDLV